MGLKAEMDSVYLTEVESGNDRIVQYPAAWAGFNLISNGAIGAQAWMAANIEIVPAATIADPCWLLGISLGGPVVEAFQADILIATGAGAGVTIVTVAVGTNVWPAADWTFPIVWFKERIKITGSPRLSYNMRKSTAVSAAGFNICHLIAATGIAT